MLQACLAFLFKAQKRHSSMYLLVSQSDTIEEVEASDSCSAEWRCRETPQAGKKQAGGEEDVRGSSAWITPASQS